MIDSGASVHVCPPDHGQENRLRKSSKTRPLLTASGAEMKQHGMRQVSYDTEVGKITTDYRVLDVRRPIWSLGSMMDSGCDVHFTKNRCWISKDDGKELDMIRSGGVFFVAARPSKLSSKEASTLELDPMTAAEVEQAALAREHAAFAAGVTLGGDGQPAVRIKVPTGLATPSAEESALHEASGHVPYRRWCQWCIAARAADMPHLRGSHQKQMKPCQELSLTSRISDERRIKYCQFVPSMQSMSVLRACQQHFVPRKHSVSIWWKRFRHSLKQLDTMW